MSVLELEYATFEARKMELIAQGHEGTRILIIGAEVVGVYATEPEALKRGHELLGIGTPFLVQEIREVERTILHSRMKACDLCGAAYIWHLVVDLLACPACQDKPEAQAARKQMEHDELFNCSF